jgi:hypothetical protein
LEAHKSPTIYQNCANKPSKSASLADYSKPSKSASLADYSLADYRISCMDIESIWMWVVSMHVSQGWLHRRKRKPDYQGNWTSKHCSQWGLQTTFVGPAVLAADTLRVWPMALQALGLLTLYYFNYCYEHVYYMMWTKIIL